MIKSIEVPTSEMEIVRYPQWDEKCGYPCYWLKPKAYNRFYWAGTEKECREWFDFFKKIEG